ncbi:hypothetical protein ILUMI_10445 [Ignelater luminosus]|uniref:C-type lectin domain-containing protein n=1 Tax=Ignelater luminosus TaxID=2038154 RepID=A0A8K0GE61_IGNLU|nr:hypothetical protein ILUMI_10445 [Ignelater luminosus]
MFSFNDTRTEYILNNVHSKYIQAKLACKFNFKAKLAVVKNLRIANFLAEALSEIDFKTGSLWVGSEYNEAKKIWVWNTDKQIEPISDEVNATMKVNKDVIELNRKCLAFARSNHDKPELRPLPCIVYRGSLCERPSDGDMDGSSHVGWIRIKNKLYKIFTELVPYDEVEVKCFKHDPESKPAVIKSYKTAQILGRYLLIGRPSLENAWIGARWWPSQFYFEFENVPLKNTTNEKTHYPPWRNNTLQKPAGCLLLDRHLSNITYFVEARCKRLRPYICYKKVISINDTINNTYADIIIDDRGYRIHYMLQPWKLALKYCKDRYKKYGGKLVEITHPNMVYELLYVMGENKTTAQHIWIAGKYKRLTKEDITKWYWVSNNEPVDMTYVPVLGNKTDRNYFYSRGVEDFNTCLNMDRENHVMALFYGTICFAEQFFVCLFDAQNLIRLQEEEHQGTDDGYMEKIYNRSSVIL